MPSYSIASRRQGTETFGATLRNAGVAADVQVATELTHEQVNEAVGLPGDTVITPPLMHFFRSCTTP